MFGQTGAQRPFHRSSTLLIKQDPAAGDYSPFPTWQSTPALRSWNFWGYIDARDAADAVVKSVLATLPNSSLQPGSHVFIIANADTVMQKGNQELIEGLPYKVEKKEGWEGNKTLLGIGKAQKVRSSGGSPKLRPSVGCTNRFHSHRFSVGLRSTLGETEQSCNSSKS